MTKSFSPRLLLMTLLLSIPLIMLTCGSDDKFIYSARAEQVRTDSVPVPKPKYQYFLTMKRMEIPEWNSAADSLNQAHNKIGNTLTKDESLYYLELADRQMRKILRRFQVDSVEIKLAK
jgi:hypothetical protein